MRVPTAGLYKVSVQYDAGPLGGIILTSLTVNVAQPAAIGTNDRIWITGISPSATAVLTCGASVKVSIAYNIETPAYASLWAMPLLSNRWSYGCGNSKSPTVLHWGTGTVECSLYGYSPTTVDEIKPALRFNGEDMNVASNSMPVSLVWTNAL